MELRCHDYMDGVAVLEVHGPLVNTTSLQGLARSVEVAISRGRTGILFDLSKVSRVNFSGLVALVELPGLFERAHIAFCELPKWVAKKLAKTGLDLGLSLFQTKREALRSDRLRSRGLLHTNALIFCDGTTGEIGAIGGAGPELLDVHGSPLIERNLAHWARFGLQQLHLVLNRGETALPNYLKNHRSFGQSIAFLRGVSPQSPPRRGQPRISCLRRLFDRHCLFLGDTIVGFGRGQNTLDLVDMMRWHRSESSDVTYCCPGVKITGSPEMRSEETRLKVVGERNASVSRDLQSAVGGCFILSEEAAQRLIQLPDELGMLEAIEYLAKGGSKIQIYSGKTRFLSTESPKHYFDLLCANFHPDFTSEWQNPVEGPEPGNQGGECTFVSERADVSRSAELLGHCFIQQGAKVSKNVVLQNCIALPGAVIDAGFWGQNLIIGADGILNHQFPRQIPRLGAKSATQLSQPDGALSQIPA